jgi:hypothetical protein
MIRTIITPLKDRYSFVEVSDRIAFMYRALKRSSSDGRKDTIQCAYFGFEEESKAKKMAAWVRQKYPLSRCVVRESERLEHCLFEVKVFRFPEILDLILGAHNAAA